MIYAKKQKVVFMQYPVFFLMGIPNISGVFQYFFQPFPKLNLIVTQLILVHFFSMVCPSLVSDCVSALSWQPWGHWWSWRGCGWGGWWTGSSTHSHSSSSPATCMRPAGGNFGEMFCPEMIFWLIQDFLFIDLFIFYLVDLSSKVQGLVQRLILELF